jgi:two-component system, OmpR family, lantibiotic biosynthesis response regulator NisR/SpaR
LWGEQQPDTILLDVDLPQIDGFVLCQRIQEQSANPGIFHLGQSATCRCIKRWDTGADDYVTKPFSGDELLTRIQAQVRHRMACFPPRNHL